MKVFCLKVLLLMAIAGSICSEATGRIVHRCADLSSFPVTIQDTIIYSRNGFKAWWNDEDFKMAKGESSGVEDPNDTSDFEEIELTVGTRPMAMDTLIAPDSLRLADPFAYEFWPAITDSICHRYVRDSLLTAGDSLKSFRIDSLYMADSLVKAKLAFAAWYASLDKFERKRYDADIKSAIQKAKADSIQYIKDSLQAIRDSTIENTPRILETYILPDSLKFKRIISWTHERDFHNLKIREPDTTYNYRFYDYPFQRGSVNAYWLGVVGSPVQDYDFTKRKSEDDVLIYDTQQSWTFSPATMPMYNTKTAYTELGYSGGLFDTSVKLVENVHVLVTQNIFPSWNLMVSFDSYSAKGMLTREQARNRTFTFGTNYLGKKYLMNAGYIFNGVNMQENGGLASNAERDRKYDDARELNVALSNAESHLQKHSVFVDQQLRIPFYFLEKWFKKKSPADSTVTAFADSLDGVKPAEAARPKPLDENITTAFVGHSSDLSFYKRIYDDKISLGTKDTVGRKFFNDVFNYNPTTSHDSLRTMKLENKIFLRLQPWAQEAVVSKIDAGIGNRITTYSNLDPSLLKQAAGTTWNTTYLYAGVEGKVKQYFDWNALGHYSLFGSEAGDFDVSANARFNVFPFRKHREHPISFDVNFSTSLRRPAYYVQHLYTNHYSWDNDFTRVSDTRIKGTVDIPVWKFRTYVAYSLIGNGIYFDDKGTPQQSASAANVLTVGLDKDFVLWKFHLDHKLLFQLSSNTLVANVPTFAANLRYYIQFPLGKVDKKAMDMQIGVNGWYNTLWYAPGWNPVLGVFHNQSKNLYGNSPYFDVFLNVRWHRTCLFVKYENALMNIATKDFYSADHYLRTHRVFKFGIYWPFYTMPASRSHSHSKRGGPANNDN